MFIMKVRAATFVPGQFELIAFLVDRFADVGVSRGTPPYRPEPLLLRRPSLSVIYGLRDPHSEPDSFPFPVVFRVHTEET